MSAFEQKWSELEAVMSESFTAREKVMYGAVFRMGAIAALTLLSSGTVTNMQLMAEISVANDTARKLAAK